MICLWPAILLTMHECITGDVQSQTLPRVQNHRYWLRMIETEMMITSGSISWIRSLSQPSLNAWISCTNNRVSASVWLQGARGLTPSMVLKTSWYFLNTFLSVLHGFTICMNRNANRWALFLFSLRNSHQMCGTQTFPVTICYPPWLIGSWLVISGCIPHRCSSTLYRIVNLLQKGFYICRVFEVFTTCWGLLLLSYLAWCNHFLGS